MAYRSRPARRSPARRLGLYGKTAEVLPEISTPSPSLKTLPTSWLITTGSRRMPPTAPQPLPSRGTRISSRMHAGGLQVTGCFLAASAMTRMTSRPRAPGKWSKSGSSRPQQRTVTCPRRTIVEVDATHRAEGLHLCYETQSEYRPLLFNQSGGMAQLVTPRVQDIIAIKDVHHSP